MHNPVPKRSRLGGRCPKISRRPLFHVQQTAPVHNPIPGLPPCVLGTIGLSPGIHSPFRTVSHGLAATTQCNSSLLIQSVDGGPLKDTPELHWVVALRHTDETVRIPFLSQGHGYRTLPQFLKDSTSTIPALCDDRQPDFTRYRSQLRFRARTTAIHTPISLQFQYHAGMMNKSEPLSAGHNHNTMDADQMQAVRDLIEFAREQVISDHAPILEAAKIAEAYLDGDEDETLPA